MRVTYLIISIKIQGYVGEMLVAELNLESYASLEVIPKDV